MPPGPENPGSGLSCLILKQKKHLKNKRLCAYDDGVTDSTSGRSMIELAVEFSAALSERAPHV